MGPSTCIVHEITACNGWANDIITFSISISRGAETLEKYMHNTKYRVDSDYGNCEEIYALFPPISQDIYLPR